MFWAKIVLGQGSLGQSVLGQGKLGQNCVGPRMFGPKYTNITDTQVGQNLIQNRRQPKTRLNRGQKK